MHIEETPNKKKYDQNIVLNVSIVALLLTKKAMTNVHIVETPNTQKKYDQNISLNVL